MTSTLLSHIIGLKTSRQKSLAVLIDPDKAPTEHVLHLIGLAEAYTVDYFLVGGSLISDDRIHQLVSLLKTHSEIPIVLFPGNTQQIVPEADAILFLSLISGRNPDLLIGKHVESAPLLRQSGMEVISTGYMLIESGKLTTANYITQTLPIPADKPDVASSTALAGEMLGLKLIYLDAGSGALRPVSSEMITAVANCVEVPLIVGGGIRSSAEAERIWQAGADLIVIGNAIERDPKGTLVSEVAQVKHRLQAAKLSKG